MEHEQLEEAVAAYALGALDAGDRHEVERSLLEHLPGCASCRELFNDLREVTGDLALVAPPRRVPEAVEERILDAIRDRAPRSERAPLRPRSVFSRVAAVAAAAAIVALGAWNVQLASRVDDARDRTAGMTAAISLLGASDAHTSTLKGDDGTLVFVWRPGEAVLVGHDVTAPPSDRVLQLWLMRAGVPTSAGVFRPDGGGVVLALRVDPSGFDGVAVTVERGPKGAARPSGAPIYSGLITA